MASSKSKSRSRKIDWKQVGIWAFGGAAVGALATVVITKITSPAGQVAKAIAARTTGFRSIFGHSPTTRAQLARTTMAARH